MFINKCCEGAAKESFAQQHPFGFLLYEVYTTLHLFEHSLSDRARNG